MACLAPPLLLPVCLHANAESPAWSTTLPCHASSLPQLPISALLTIQDECFFHSLVVGLPCKWFSVNSGCSLLLNWLLSFFWLCKEAKCFCLCLRLGRNSLSSKFFWHVEVKLDLWRHQKCQFMGKKGFSKLSLFYVIPAKALHLNVVSSQSLRLQDWFVICYMN